MINSLYEIVSEGMSALSLLEFEAVEDSLSYTDKIVKISKDRIYSNKGFSITIN